MRILRLLLATFWIVSPLFLLSGCIEPYQPYTRVAPGIWRGVLELNVQRQAPAVQDGKLQEHLAFEEVTNGELPFLFEVIYDNDTSFHIEIINGKERIPVYDISFGRSKARAKDSICIDFPVYDTHIEALVEADVMEGEWVVHYRPDYRVHFVARHEVHAVVGAVVDHPLAFHHVGFDQCLDVRVVNGKIDADAVFGARFGPAEADVVHGNALLAVDDFDVEAGVVVVDHFEEEGQLAIGHFFEGEVLLQLAVLHGRGLSLHIELEHAAPDARRYAGVGLVGLDAAREQEKGRYNPECCQQQTQDAHGHLSFFEEVPLN